MEKSPSDLQRFLWWVACTDEEAILLCSPVTRFYQTIAGTMILITTLLAFISGGYAILQVVHHVVPTIPLAAIYAMAIFSIDRFIVSARGRQMAWFRLPLALVIGCVIAVPLELRLVQERIEQELNRLEQSENQGAEDSRTTQRDELQGRINKLEQRADEYRNQISEWGAKIEAEVVGRVRAGSTGLAGEGPAHRAAVEQKQLNIDLLGQVNVELERLRAQQSGTFQQIEKEYQRKRVAQPRDLLAQYEALHIIEREHPETAKMTWAITILLILIELFPALVKLMLPYTAYAALAYAALVEAREREDIQRGHSMGNYNIRQIVAEPHNPGLFVIKQTAAVRQAANSGGD